MATRTTTNSGTDELHAPAVALYKALVKLVPDGSDRVNLTLEEIVKKGRLTRRFTNGSGKVDMTLVDRAWRYLRDMGAVEIVGRAKRPVKSPEGGRSTTRRSSAGRSRAAKATKRGRSGPANKRTTRGRKASGRKASGRKASGNRASGSRASARKVSGSRASQSRSRASASSTAAKRSTAGAKKTPKTAGARAAASGASNGTGRHSDGVAVLAGALDSFTGQLGTSLERVWALRQEIAATEDQLSALEAEHNHQVNELAAFRNELRDARLAAFFDTMVGDELWVYETPATPAP